MHGPICNHNHLSVAFQDFYANILQLLICLFISVHCCLCPLMCQLNCCLCSLKCKHQTWLLKEATNVRPVRHSDLLPCNVEHCMDGIYRQLYMRQCGYRSTMWDFRDIQCKYMVKCLTRSETCKPQNISSQKEFYLKKRTQW